MLVAGADAGAAPAPGPGAATGFHTGVRGVGADGTEPAADLAAGFDLRVDPSAPHAHRIGAAMSYAVAQVRRYGIDVRYQGIGVKPKDSATYGQMTVRESTDPRSTTCVSRTSAENGIVVDASTVPSFQDVGIASRVNAAEITFCPPMWASDQDYVESIALHELGHAVGLGHYAATFQGVVQIMNPAVPDLQEYQAGDINGLRYLAAQTAAVQRASTVRGQVESWQVTNGGLDVAGWAIVGTTYQFANIDVTRDGATVYAITTGGPRPDITARFGARWPNSGFHGSQITMTPGTHRYCVAAAVPTAPDARTVLRLPHPGAAVAGDAPSDRDVRGRRRVGCGGRDAGVGVRDPDRRRRGGAGTDGARAGAAQEAAALSPTGIRVVASAAARQLSRIGTRTSRSSATSTARS